MTSTEYELRPVIRWPLFRKVVSVGIRMATLATLVVCAVAMYRWLP